VQLWLNEKAELLAKEDYGRDAKAADKLLTKHKVDDFSSLWTCRIISVHPTDSVVVKLSDFDNIRI